MHCATYRVRNAYPSSRERLRDHLDQTRLAVAVLGDYAHMTTMVIATNMRKIQLKDAKAKLSSVVDEAVRGKPSVITRHGRPEAVVLGFAEWQRLSRVPSFGRLLMSAPLEPGDLPDRNRAPTRGPGL
jgi:antitoxin Phd